jgi:hypothetical protein
MRAREIISASAPLPCASGASRSALRLLERQDGFGGVASIGRFTNGELAEVFL